MIVRIFKQWMAAYRYGQAIARFQQQRYEDAAVLFEKICSLDPNNERNELHYSYLGRSYLALGKTAAALDVLSRAYQPFREKSGRLTSDFERGEYIEFLRSFSEVLTRLGQLDRAKEIAREAEEFCRRTA